MAGVVTEAGVIRTRTVVLAAGACASSFCRQLDIRFPQAAVRSSILAVGPGAEGPDALDHDQIELADFYIEYHKLMAHWRKTYPGRIFDIRYDRMVRDPEAVMREVCEFCALEFTPEMLAIGNRKRGVSTASAGQVREGIQVRDVPKWKPYETYLQPMITRLRQGGVLEGWEQA